MSSKSSNYTERAGRIILDISAQLTLAFLQKEMQHLTDQQSATQCLGLLGTDTEQANMHSKWQVQTLIFVAKEELDED